MKRLIAACGLAASIVAAPMALADEYGGTREHQYVKDSLITTKVKSTLAAKHLSTLAKVKVDTDANGVVWLSGQAPTQDAVDIAGMIAKDTEGVKSVHNDIVVQP